MAAIYRQMARSSDDIYRLNIFDIGAGKHDVSAYNSPSTPALMYGGRSLA